LAVNKEDTLSARRFFCFFFFITLGLELSDTKVYEPEIRALLGTASHYRFWKSLIDQMAKFGRLGERLPLCCASHPDKRFDVAVSSTQSL